MTEIIATVYKITYKTEDGYCVLSVTVKGRLGRHTAVGTLPDVHTDSTYKFGGEWVIHKKYGEQFKIETAEEMLPTTETGIIRYLSSGLISGIGQSTAKKIVSKLGINTLDVIDQTPERLLEVSGIGKKKAENIIENLKKQKDMRKTMMFLNSNGVGIKLATKIYKEFGDNTIQFVQENPYKLTEIKGIGFLTADDVAQKIGFGHETYVRLKSGLLYTLLELSKDGHCYATRNMLIEKGVKLLSVDDYLLHMTLDEMLRVEDVITDITEEDDPKKAIFLPMFYYAELGVANRLSKIFATKTKNRNIKLPKNIDYDETQKKAIETAINSKIFILTGGPGTGKTTTVLGIIQSMNEKEILLAAPTGRAAKRLSESTGKNAKTIHRLLEAKRDGSFTYNETHKLKGDVLIVDECSMIDIILMNQLLKAVPENMQVILVGDIDQLPSVGPGNVLRDIIESNEFPVVRLQKIFRQAATSRIIQNAHYVNEGRMPDWTPKNSDFFFINAETESQKQHQNLDEYALEQIAELVANKLPNYYKIPSEQIQVLSPMRQGKTGTVMLNQYLQKRLNHTQSYGIHSGAIVYHIGDKVMQTVNNYDKNIYNGDIGFVCSIDRENQTATIDFDGREISYSQQELDEITLAYAITIHKSQGSEYPIVVMPVFMSHYVLLQRNLLYTGITRAKQILVMIGQKNAVAYAVSNNLIPTRNTMLSKRIKESIK